MSEYHVRISKYAPDQFPHANWTPLLVIKTGVMLLSICLNVGVGFYHLTSPSQVTPFSVYLVGLFIMNVIYCSMCTPLEIASELYGDWWMGHWACNFYNYFEFVISLGPVMLHALIAVSRIWAVAYPVSYREKHTYKIAILLSALGFGYAHIVDVPGYVIDMLYYHLPEKEYGCRLHTAVMREWSRAESVMCRLSPLLLIMLAYVYVTAAIWRRKRRRTAATYARNYELNTLPVNSTETAVVQEAQSVTTVCKHPVKEVKASLILTLTAISVMICWLPADAMFVAYLFFGIPFSTTTFTVVMLLYSIQGVFDPLMLLFSLRRIAD
ncbi:alpha-2B adrenergic receptor-like [Paramacrobiotus metropolitanus]|uniref:alpha-2B adrenergic receptor-like n=1 Tax=Paramacrobiotus metropolitanus TaxID=2943436 RepID=UPI0024458731|nr:alpha-2B adrenergic receptor-like [Paramacrobiotus metropolitanus]